MFLALREIRHEPARFALIISVITLVAYLTFFLGSLAIGHTSTAPESTAGTVPASSSPMPPMRTSPPHV